MIGTGGVHTVAPLFGAPGGGGGKNGACGLNVGMGLEVWLSILLDFVWI
jgi:hypothetical protein